MGTFGVPYARHWCWVVEVKVREVNGVHRVLVVRAWGSEKPKVVYHEDKKFLAEATRRMAELKVLYGS